MLDVDHRVSFSTLKTNVYYCEKFVSMGLDTAIVKMRPRFHFKIGLFSYSKKMGTYNFGEDDVRLDGKTAIITGSNTGIGKYNALEFCRRGSNVIMACRDLEKADRAKYEILTDLKDVPHKGKLIIKRLDLSYLESVRRLAEELLSQETHIHILVNNAGVMMCPKQTTKDGFEMQFGTNHLGHFLLTMLLLPVIIDSAPSRIINLSSMAYKVGSINFDDLNWEKTRYSPLGAYARSKLANVLFTKELARRLKGRCVNAYAVHPGLVRTELGRHMDSVIFPGFRAIYRKCFGWCAKTPRQGAETSVYCAVSKRVSNETGLFYADCRPVDVGPKASDEQLARRLWKVSCEMVGLTDSYPFPFEKDRG